MNIRNIPLLPHEEKLKSRQQAIKSYRAKADAKRTLAEKAADWMTGVFGSVWFLTLNLTWFVVWIVWNTEIVPGVEPFDPFPFGLLTMVVSLEAIFLAIIVLISQNRAGKIAEVREEVDLYINTLAEGEITKEMKMLALLLEKAGVDIEDDPELAKMLKPISNDQLETSLEEELSSNKKSQNS